MAGQPPAVSAHLVSAGILLSRLAGLLREAVFARYLGTSEAADAFRAALRMPNAIQNLLGEGTLSASFIPVYAELLERGRHEEAGRVAGAVFAFLLTIAGALSLLGILLAPALVTVLTPGFEGVRREVAITCTRIIFPMTGLLVLSAWALGVLNSHRRFFISYVAPVAWNGAIILALAVFGGRLMQAELAVAAALGALLGGAFQFALQLPWLLQMERQLRIRWDLKLAGVRKIFRNAGPVILGRGAVQLGTWVDLILASTLAAGAVVALAYAQTMYLLPIGLFGMAVAAAELPELARQREISNREVVERVRAGLRQIAVFVVPVTAGYLVIGEALVAAIFERGEFGPADTRLVYLVLVGYTLGLLASTASRLQVATFFALQDSRTPARLAILRVFLAGTMGLVLMLQFQKIEVMGHPLGALGLSLAAGLAAWIEWLLLRRKLSRRIGAVRTGTGFLVRLCVAAAVPASALFGLLQLAPPLPALPKALALLALYVPAYFLLAHVLGVREAQTAFQAIARRLRA